MIPYVALFLGSTLLVFGGTNVLITSRRFAAREDETRGYFLAAASCLGLGITLVCYAALTLARLKC